jgi:hypothetical protein
MSAAEDLCRELGLRPPSYRPGRYYTTCPRCSTRRQHVHQSLKCLGITIEPDGVHAGCNHCGWTAGRRGHRLRHPHRPAWPRPATSSRGIEVPPPATIRFLPPRKPGGKGSLRIASRSSS